MMQIPRGTFRDLKKGIHLEDLLQGMSKASFCGYCKIVTKEGSDILVLRGGRVILAHSGNFQGDEALAAIIRREDSGVDAILHDLSTAQLQLAIEFNPADQVLRTENAHFHRELTQGKSARALQEPLEDKKEKLKAKPPKVPSVKDASEAKIKDWHQGSDQKGDLATSPLLQELEALDMKDIEHIAEKFRENCRQMIERLELEYLLDSEKQEGGS
jgi:hypothetical protein